MKLHYSNKHATKEERQMGLHFIVTSATLVVL